MTDGHRSFVRPERHDALLTAIFDIILAGNVISRRRRELIGEWWSLDKGTFSGAIRKRAGVCARFAHFCACSVDLSLPLAHSQRSSKHAVRRALTKHRYISAM
jgi:hypothetical protein